MHSLEEVEKRRNADEVTDGQKNAVLEDLYVGNIRWGEERWMTAHYFQEYQYCIVKLCQVLYISVIGTHNLQ